MDIDILSDDVLTEVLCRLPPSGLAASRCVSRRWNAVISSPCFPSLHAKAQSSKSSHTTGFLRAPHRESGPITFVPLDSEGRGHRRRRLPEWKVHVVAAASCGLLLIRWMRSSSTNRDYWGILDVETRAAEEIDPPPCDHWKTPFGLYATPRHYVVVTCHNGGESCATFSSRTRRWTRTNVAALPERHVQVDPLHNPTGGVLARNGRMHWLAAKDRAVLAVRVGMEAVEVVGLPEGVVTIHYKVYSSTLIGAVGDALHLMHADEGGLRVVVWVLLEGGEWKEVVRLRTARLESPLLYDGRRVVLVPHGSWNHVGADGLVAAGRRLDVYDVVTEKFSYSGEIPFWSGNLCIFLPYRRREDVVPLLRNDVRFDEEEWRTITMQIPMTGRRLHHLDQDLNVRRLHHLEF